MIIKRKPDEIAAYLEDSSNLPGAKVEAVYIPESEDEARETVAGCARRGELLTISGGGTGNVAGRLPLGGSLLSVERMVDEIVVNPAKMTAAVSAGVLVEDFLARLEKDGFFYPPFPTERTAFVSGNAATNASGEYSYRFGPTRRYVRRLRVLTTGGEVFEVRRGENFADREGRIRLGGREIRIPGYLTPDIKCAAGYYSRPGMDAIDLLIGSEGTLGVFTSVEVEIIPVPPPRTILVLFYGPDRDPLELLPTARSQPLFTLEYFDRHSLDFLVPDFGNIPDGAHFALYLETEVEKLDDWLEIVERTGPLDTWASQDEAAYRKLIGFRHRLPENINRYFKKIGTRKVSLDFAVPEDRFRELYAYYQALREANPELETVLFGHLGENHLHFNYFPRDEKEREKIRGLYDRAARKVVSLGGTVAAEHGVGKMKHRYLAMMYGEEGLREMARVKREIDPACILGLDNIFPRSLLGK